MKITVLGASGSEVPGHNPPAFLIDDFLLLDAGTVSLSLSREAQCRITHVFLSHAHLDHIKGIPFLVDNIVLSKQHCRLTILSGKDVLDDLRGNIFNNRIWPDFTKIPNAEPVMSYCEISPDVPFEIRGYRIFATEVNHLVPAYGYLVEEVSTGKTLLYTGDTGPTEKIWKCMENHDVKLLIVEVSFPDEMQELAMASGHLTPSLLEHELHKMPTVPEKIYAAHLKPFYKKTIQAQLTTLNGFRTDVIEEGMVLFI